MANPRTQIRQQQLTGSTVDIKARLDNTATINNNQPGLASALTGSSQLDLFGYVGAALHRIHGAASDEPFNNQAGELSDGAQVRVKYTNGGDTTIRGDGGAIDLTINDSLVRAHDNFQVDGDTTILGNLKVTGDTTTTYITSSVVEFQDPMMVTNAADMSTAENVAKARKAGTSFLSASADIEAAAGTQGYDYGVLGKRALGYSAGAGASNSAGQAASAIKSRGHMLEGANLVFEDTGNTKIGAPLGVFKTTALGSTIDDTGTAQTLTLDTVPRPGVNPADLLGAHLGAYVLLSSSHAPAEWPKRFGVIQSANPATNEVTIKPLISTETYDGLGLSGNIQQPAMQDGRGSIQLLSAYAGTIFDKEEYEFHHAAAAITGSGDNKFISGSANVMLYGGVKSARMALMENNVISGSRNVGQFDWVPEATGATKAYVTLKSIDSEDLLLKSAGDLILSGTSAVQFVTNNGGSITLPAADGTVDQVMITNGAGALSFDDVGNLIPALARSVFKVKTGVSIAAGLNSLILTGALASAVDDSEHFVQLQTAGVDSNIADKINELTDVQLFNRVSVFVNGQLLASGSGTAAGVTAGADYTLKRINASVPPQISGSFAFDLEEDDIITIVAQAVS